MPSPTITFGFVLATLYGALFHLLFGGNARRLALFLIAGWFGFVVGHALGAFLGVRLFTVGVLHAFSASLGALVALFVTLLLTSNRTKSSSY